MDGKGILRFILILPSVSEKGQFKLRDLPGSGGRVDILCRSLAACFDWGPATWPKSMLELVAVIANKVTLRVQDPGKLLPRGEAQWAETIRRVLNVWVLEETGKPFGEIKTMNPDGENTFIVGDHRGFDSQTQLTLDDHSIYRISVGKRSYLSSHCIAAIISKFERMVV